MSSPGLSALVHPLWTVAGMPMSIGDVLGFVTGLGCVWLTARANIWNFPLGIVNSAILGLVFFSQRLFADASLQLVFIVLGVRGWVEWHSGQHAGEDSPVFRSSTRVLAALIAAVPPLTLVLWSVLRWLGGSAPVLDALITALSLCAQWLLNRRALETWLFWICVDVISVPLYLSRGLPLIAALFAIFLGLCVQGLRRWQRLAAPRAAAEAA